MWWALAPGAVFAAWVASILAASPRLAAAAAFALLLSVFAAASIRQPLVFVVTFLVILIVLPPFFRSWSGETPIYVSNFLVPIGLAIVLARLPDFHFRLDPVAKALGLFLLGTATSLPFAYWNSGVELGNASTLRWLLMAQAALIYVLVRGGATAREGRAELWLLPILLAAGTISALSGIVDFYWPIPLPHPAADQYVWLWSGALRRAQGVFYEASSFANLCGFFLLIVSAAFLTRQERVLDLACPWLGLLIPILSLAVFVSFSRSAWGSVAVSLAVFAILSRKAHLRRAMVLLLMLAVPLAGLWYYTPDVWDYLVNARLGQLAQIFSDPNLASSGRSETWARLLAIVEDHPQFLVFGVGYKTLPYTRLFHEGIITDNGYLSLLLETGIVGFGSYLFLSVAILRTFLKLARPGGRAGCVRLARRSGGRPAFWSALMFSLWCGQLVQMLATDAHTYWRNMILFFAIMALTMNHAERAGLLPGQNDARPFDDFEPARGKP